LKKYFKITESASLEPFHKKHYFYDLHATIKDEYKDLDPTDTLTPLKDML
jgi:hypothetical protein